MPIPGLEKSAIRRSNPSSKKAGLQGLRTAIAGAARGRFVAAEYSKFSIAPGDLSGFDIEDFAGCADLGKRSGIRAGHPDLRAELCQLVEQRRAPVRIEMRHHLIK